MKRVVVLAINLLHNGEIETAKQVSAERRDISRPAVTSDLNHAVNPLGQVSNEVVCVAVITFASEMRDNQFRAAFKRKERVEVPALGFPQTCTTLADANTRPKFVQLNGFGFDVAHNLIVKAFTLRADDTNHFKHSVLVTAAQSRRCANATAFAQASHDLNDFSFVQTNADETALLVECFPASRVKATEALHRCRLGFEAAKLFDFTAAAYTVVHLRLSRPRLKMCVYLETQTN
ncbi:MAG: hypothetical protein ABSG87_03900 [Verrucomicrobiota bacterium]